MSAVAIVTHCWAVDKPFYAVLLRYQLSSLVLHPPVTKIHPIVAYDPKDRATSDVVDDFKSMCPGWLETIQLTERQMWRRAIARNIAAQQMGPICDLVWFTDCDHLFGYGCIDMAKAAWLHADKPEMIWPAGYFVNSDKTPLDCALERYLKRPPARGELLRPPSMEDEIMKLNRAIGGVQIVAGTYAASHGYLPGSRWQREPLTPFPDFRDDVRFRIRIERRFRHCRIPVLPGLYRLRHTDVGYGLASPNP